MTAEPRRPAGGALAHKLACSPYGCGVSWGSVESVPFLPRAGPGLAGIQVRPLAPGSSEPPARTPPPR